MNEVKELFKEYDEMVKSLQHECVMKMINEGVDPYAITVERKPGPPKYAGIGLPSFIMRGGEISFTIKTSLTENGIQFITTRNDLITESRGPSQLH